MINNIQNKQVRLIQIKKNKLIWQYLDNHKLRYNKLQMQMMLEYKEIKLI